MGLVPGEQGVYDVHYAAVVQKSAAIVEGVTVAEREPVHRQTIGADAQYSKIRCACCACESGAAVTAVDKNGTCN